MKKFLLATVATIGFAATAFPSIAATTPANTSSLSQALLQAQLEKCIANDILTLDQVKGMSDDELTKALDECTKVLAQANTPAPIVQAAPVVVPAAPVFVDRPVISRRVSRRFDNDFGGGGGGGFNGVGNGGTIDVGGIGNINGDNNVGGGIGGQIGQIGDVIAGGLGEIGGGAGAGAGAGAGGGQGGGAVVPQGIDGRIAGLKSGLAEGIASGSITPTEAGAIGKRIAEIEATRSTLGDNGTARLILNGQLDAAATDFNSKVRNNDGIPNPDLFRAFKRKTPNGLTAALGDNNTGPKSFRDRLRERFAKNGNGTDGVTNTSTGPQSAFDRFKARLAKRQADQQGGVADASKSAGPKSAFERFKERMAQRRDGLQGNKGIAGGLQTTSKSTSGFDRFKERMAKRREAANTGIGGGLKTGTTTTSGFDRFKERMAQRRASQVSNGGLTSKLTQRRVQNTQVGTSANTQRRRGTEVFMQKLAQKSLRTPSNNGNNNHGGFFKRRLAKG